MEKKYQIFISSTFLDLKDERQAASRAILNLGHIPSGMELFPASNIDQLSYIKKSIDLCDYYVLILAGRYGSLGPENLSYTELEYNYAKEKGIPVISFVSHDIGELKSANVDKDPEQAIRLERFKKRVQENKLCNFWSNAADLEAKVVTSLTAAFSDEPQIGWTRHTDSIPKEALEKINNLREGHDYYSKKYFEADSKITSYEDLGKSRIEIKFSSEHGLHRHVASGEDLIREFASPLIEGLTRSTVEDGLRTIAPMEGRPWAPAKPSYRAAGSHGRVSGLLRWCCTSPTKEEADHDHAPVYANRRHPCRHRHLEAPP